MVTHDQEEALSLSDRIAVMKNGCIEQVGSPSEIYEHPATAFVADFIGDTNLLSGRIQQQPLMLVTSHGLQVAISPLSTDLNKLNDTTSVDVSIRPEKIHISTQAEAARPTTHDNYYQGEVKHTLYTGPHIHCIIELATGEQLRVLQPNHVTYQPGTLVHVSWASPDCQVLV